MKWKKLTETFMMISNLKNFSGLHSLYKIFQRCKGYRQGNVVNPLTAGAAYIRIFIFY